MRVEKIFFNTEDNVELFGLLHTSESKNDKEVVIAIHGMGSNCFKQRDDIIAQKLTSNNIKRLIVKVNTFNEERFNLNNLFMQFKIKNNKHRLIEGVKPTIKPYSNKNKITRRYLGLSPSLCNIFNKKVLNNPICIPEMANK